MAQAPDTISFDDAVSSPDVTSTKTQTATAPPQEGPVMGLLNNLGRGVARGVVSTMSVGDDWARQHLPPFFTNSNFGFGPPADLNKIHQLTQPQNMTEAVGKGLEQAGEFLIPGGAEEKAASYARLIPGAEKAMPAIRTGISALSAGGVNKLQGGSFEQGALTGGATGAAGEGFRALAPKIAEGALAITKPDRAFGKTPGAAVLNETRGFRPSDIAETGQTRLRGLTSQLEGKVDSASSRPAPRIAGFLPPPTEEVPLHEQPFQSGRASRPIVLNQPDRPMPLQLEAPPSETPLASQGKFENGRLTPQGVLLRPQEFPAETSGMTHGEYFGEVPGTYGGRQPLQGVMLRRPEMSASIPPAFEANPSASLAPARGVIANAMGKAGREEAGSLHGQLGELNDFLHTGKVSGEPIPTNVTPRRLLDLKRGFATEFLGRWNPETHGGTLSAGRRAYHALDSELDRTVPEAADLNQRVSSLLPVVHRAESTARNAPMAQKIVGRFVAPTGALASALYGAHEGAQHGGMQGALAGGTAGLLAPLLIGTPEGQMIAARTFNSPATARVLRGLAVPILRSLTAQQKEREGQQQ